MENNERTETAEKQDRPSIRKLLPGHLVNEDIEIVGLMHSDCSKNVYEAQWEDSPCVVVETSRTDFISPAAIPCRVERYFFKPDAVIEGKQACYWVVKDEDFESLADMAIPCREPEIVRLLHALLTAFTDLCDENLDVSDVFLKDIHVIDDHMKFLIVPRVADVDSSAGGQVQETAVPLIGNLFEKRIRPSITRNLEEPLSSLCLSSELTDLVKRFLRMEAGLEEVRSELDAMSPAENPDWRLYSATDVGMVRQLNEDACGHAIVCVSSDEASPNYVAMCVSDGMGGHERGEFASSFALAKWFSLVNDALWKLSGGDLENTDIVNLLNQSMEETERAFVELPEIRAISSRNKPGATLVGALVVDRIAFVANCGDSRCYLVSKDSIERVTADHSYVGMLLEQGEITEEEAFDHEQSNLITSFIGIEPKAFKKDVYIRRIFPGQGLLLCSDGLSDMLRDEEILEVLQKESDPASVVGALIGRAKEKGGEDNISAAFLVEAAGPEKNDS